MNLVELIRDQHATIIDVRSPGEFMSGSVAGAINIPVGEIPQRIDALKALTTPIILCCASGMRSANACQFLSQQGIACYDGGSWYTVNQSQAQSLVS